MVSYFQEFLSMQNTRALPNIRNLIWKVIADEENDNIIREPSKMELKVTLNAILTNSSPRPDDFGFGFYVACWEFIRVFDGSYKGIFQWNGPTQVLNFLLCALTS